MGSRGFCLLMPWTRGGAEGKAVNAHGQSALAATTATAAAALAATTATAAAAAAATAAAAVATAAQDMGTCHN